ncbi:MAG TPA: cation-translocating P-type ATPase [Candidatus Lokiarchaeia archaeon]|nr:cation-translocating P-type ATPase [Candidatus Lokiarchaeia archaeon]
MLAYDRSIQLEKFYMKTVDETLELLKTSPEGLSIEESKKRAEVHGENKLDEPPKVPGWKKFLESFTDFLVLILVGAAVFASIDAWIHNDFPTDAIVIVAILIINATLEYFQDKQAEEALDALKKLSAHKAKIIRGKDIIEDYSETLVPGDVVTMETGDQVPADCRLIEAMEFKTDEASLTGESKPVKKHVEKFDSELPLGDRTNMVFSSTTVTYGRAKGVVVATGMNSEVGKIATILEETEEQETPLTKKMDAFGKILGNTILLICAGTFLLVLWREGQASGWTDIVGVILVSIMTAVALAVAAVPEGLPAIITTSLALGVKKMAKRNAIIRKLPAVETLGCTTVICSDKTGTLTKNEMTIKSIFIDGELITVEGSGYDPTGDFLLDGDKVDVRVDESLNLIGKIGVFCNNSMARRGEKGAWIITGDPTEAAFLTLGKKIGESLTRETLAKDYRRISEVFFSSERKKMTTVDMELDRDVVFVSMKGALEAILQNCTFIHANGETREITQEDIDDMTQAQDKMADQALRVLACAYKTWSKDEMDLDPDEVEKNMILVGLVGMIDPPRPEVKLAVNECKGAGIKVVMITGDHANTAKAIANELGILPDSIKEGECCFIQGVDIDNVSDQQILETNVFARVSPEHKMRIVKVLQDAGNIVTMTGDGVNDAPALKRADAGVAMGITGTDVAKGAANIVLADDNFASIVNAVDEGRGIYDNMKRFINYLLGCNFSEIAIVFLCVLVGYQTPLEAIHLLWVNLLTDGLPALAMSFEKPDKDVMSRPPRSPKEPVITRRNWLTYSLSTLTLTLAELLIYLYGMSIIQASMVITKYNVTLPDASYFGLNWDAIRNAFISQYGPTLPSDYLISVQQAYLAHPRTLVFACMILGEMYMALNCRSETVSVFKKKFSENPWLFGAIGLSIGLTVLIIYWDAADFLFDLRALLWYEWVLIAVLCLPVIGAEEIVKIFWKRTHVIHYIEKKS